MRLLRENAPVWRYDSAVSRAFCCSDVSLDVSSDSSTVGDSSTVCGDGGLLRAAAAPPETVTVFMCFSLFPLGGARSIMAAFEGRL